jgi:hypothetical protein
VNRAAASPKQKPRPKKKRMSRLSRITLLVTAVALALIAAPVAADYAKSDWQYFKAIELPLGADRDGLVEVPIDAQTFEGSSRGLADVRIVASSSGAGDETQYKLVIERAERRRSAVSLNMRDLGSVQRSHTQFVLTLSQPGNLHNEVEILTSSRNFQRRVTVESSTDGTTWAMLKDNAEIYDFTIADRSVTTRDNHVRYPVSTAPQIRITIIDENEPPLDVQGATGFFIDDIGVREIEWPATVSNRALDSERGISHTVFDLGGHGRPANRLDLQTNQINFYRDVNLAGSDDGTWWISLRTSANIYASDTPRFRGNALSLGFADSAFRFYRLSVFNADNPPLDPLLGTVYGPAHNLIFQPHPGARYRLYYGNPLARTPSYELEHLLPYLVTENLPRAQMGTQSANPSYSRPPTPTKPFTERYPWLLPLTLTVGGLIIGFLLTRLWVEVKQKLPPPPA